MEQIARNIKIIKIAPRERTSSHVLFYGRLSAVLLLHQTKYCAIIVLRCVVVIDMLLEINDFFRHLCNIIQVS